MNSALVGMATDAIIGNAHSYPYCTFTTWSFSYHLQNPNLVRIGNRETLTFAAIAIVFHQLGHDRNCLTCCFSSLQGNVHQTSIIKHTRNRITQLLASTICSLMNSQLMFVHQSHNSIGFFYFGNFSQIIVTLVMIKRTHLALLMFTARQEIHKAVCTIIITTIRHNNAAVFTGFFSYDKIGASFGFAN